MPIRFLKNASEMADVSMESPLPVLETSKERKLVQADPLLTSVISADTNANRDILGNTSAEQPTLSHCSPYHTLIWTGVKSAASDVNYIIEARSTDFDGKPIASGWFQVATGTITGAANSWFRVVITAPDGLYFDQYRIRVQVASGTNSITSKITGVRR
ncbi:MAG: hypothetical protein KatS3mg016_0862 [Fimbriimonadales bacterium]|nr:MAG: hypothetical protein KatS3mg016_0862 [Fimbriimonadales bacterium]